MVDPYAIVKRLTGCDLISPKDGKQLIEAVDGLIDEIKGKDALIQSLSSQLAEAMEYGGQARLRENAAEDARIHEQFRASKAEAERDRLVAELELAKPVYSRRELERKVAVAKEALEPFAHIGTNLEVEDGWTGSDKLTITFDGIRLAEIDLSCFHAARTALASLEDR